MVPVADGMNGYALSVAVNEYSFFWPYPIVLFGSCQTELTFFSEKHSSPMPLPPRPSLCSAGLPRDGARWYVAAMKLLVTLIGLVFILEGLPYVASPEAMQRWLRQLAEMPPARLRLMGGIAMITGFLLCYLGQRSGIFG